MQNNVSQYQPLMLKMLGEIEDYAILFLDTQGNIGSWNKGAEKIKGYTPDEIIGKNFRVLYTVESRKGMVPELLLEEAKAKGKVQHRGWRLRKDGNVFWAHVTIIAIYDDEQQLIGYSKFTRDLTEKMEADKAMKAYARELEFRNKELEQFVYIASHDLQEPLLTVRNFIDLLRIEYGSMFDEQAEQYLEYISESAERMKDLIKGLLDYARLGSHQSKNPVNCNLIVDSIKSGLAELIESTGAQIHYQNLPVVSGYENAIRQLFENLIGNSLKFRKNDVVPEIHITASLDDHYWKFEVKDNGIGIEDRYKHKIFALFQRLHSRTDYEGYGVGLSYCKKIVELHNGEIFVESTLGKGSRFCFTLKM